MGVTHKYLRQVDRSAVMRGTGTLWRAMNALLASERDRWLLWVPVGLGAGISLFFASATEPDAALAIFSALGGLIILLTAILTWNLPPALKMALVSIELVPPGSAGPTLIIDQFDVYENGSYAIWFEEGGYRVHTASAARGIRPWTGTRGKKLNSSG